MTQFPVATTLLVLVTGISTYRGATRPAFMEKYIFSTEAILRRREYVRLASSAFLHANWLHFGFNAFTIFSFGGGIETHYGAHILLAIYFASVLGGSALSLWLHRHHDYIALGASGGACGVLFAHIFLLPGGSISPVLVPIGIPAWLYAILFLVGSYYGLKAQADDIGHDAHLGGAIIGLLLTTALYPRLVLAQPLLFAAVVAITSVIFYYLWRDPISGVRWRPRRELLQRPAPRVSPTEQLQVDALLDKVNAHGVQSLSAEERRFLQRIAERKRAGKGPG